MDTSIPSPSWSATEAAARITAGFSLGVPDPVTARAVYMGLFDHRDPQCPGGPGYSLAGLFAGCLTATGWRYAGVATYGGPEEPDVLDDFTLLGDCYIISPDGARFIGAGDLAYDRSDTDDGTDWTGLIAGQWSWPEAEGWPSDGLGSAVLDITAALTDKSWAVTLDGGFTLDGTTIVLDDVRADSATCGGEPTGTIELRDPSGYRYTLLADCGCGPLAWADGSPLGEACISASAALAALALTGAP